VADELFEGGAIGSMTHPLPTIWSWEPTGPVLVVGPTTVGNRLFDNRLAKRGWYSVVEQFPLLTERDDDDERWRLLFPTGRNGVGTVDDVAGVLSVAAEVKRMADEVNRGRVAGGGR